MTEKTISSIVENTLVVVQAGGRGDRLRPLTDTTPKPLLDVAGCPIIERLLLALVANGFRRTSLITGWQGEAIESHVQRKDADYGDMTIECVCEVKAMGNIGGLDMLTIEDRYILFLFADLVTDLKYTDLLHAHIETQSEITLASHYDEYQVQFGELIVDDAKVVSYLEKPLKKTLVGSGIAVMNTEIVKQVITGEPMGISDFVNQALRRKAVVSHWFHEALWIDVNSLHALEHANQVLGDVNPGK